MSKADFLSWDDDLDLDLLLGDFTDYDDENEFADDDDFIVAAPKKAKKTSNTSTVKETDKPVPKDVGYKCPDCNKVLKTISGFRGHTSKQHGNFNLKASKYKASPSAEENVELTQNIGTIRLDSVFDTAYKSSFDSLKCDAIFNLPQFSLENTKILSFTESKPEIHDFFNLILHDIFKSDSNITVEHDREVLFNKIHRLRLSNVIQHDCIALFVSLGYEESPHIIRFVQKFLLELVCQLIKEQVRQETKRSEIEQEQLSEKDQKILFYIAGYIVRSLRKKYSKLQSPESKELKLKCLDNLRGQSCTSFVSKFQMWTNKLDRGGLEKPSDNFFLMIREFELIIRKSVDMEKLSANSLIKNQLKEVIMDAFMVKHYMKNLFSGMEDITSDRVTEEALNLFLTVRGYAITRVERNKLVIEKKDKASSLLAKSSSSLRQVLKSKSNN